MLFEFTLKQYLKFQTLVHLTDKKCEKEVFTQQDGKTSSTSDVLSEEECQKV